MPRDKAQEVDAPTPTPRNHAAAGGNSVMTPADVSDGLKIIGVHVKRFSHMVKFSWKTGSS